MIARDVVRNLAMAKTIMRGAQGLDLRLEPGLVMVGQVEDVHGKSLSNALVQASLGNSTERAWGERVRTDGEGRFRVTALPPGWDYTVWVYAKGYGYLSRHRQGHAATRRVELAPFVLKAADGKLTGSVLDADGQPVPRAYVNLGGEGQLNLHYVRADAQGRFKFDDVCEGVVQLSAADPTARQLGKVAAEAGDTNVVIRLGVNQGYSHAEASRRPSLKGRPLPDLAAMGLNAEATPAGKPMLLCLFDLGQRPSRQFLRRLAEHHDSLRQKGITVLAVQAAVTTAEALKEWKDANPMSFPVGRVAERADKTQWASDVESLPWLILTDKAHLVTAEGFALDELDAKLKAQPKP